MAARKPSLALFVALMLVVIAIQGTYLGYTVGMLTTLEKRFGISSEPTGSLLSMYDIGHTIAILLVGYLWENGHHPKITGIGVILSAVSMFMLALPVIFFGTVSYDNEALQHNMDTYAFEQKCDAGRDFTSQADDCRRESIEHTFAYWLLAFGQFTAGIFSAPFNTLPYVYIDSNLEDRRKSPFLLGLLTSMHAFAPALGLGLSTIFNRIYTTLDDPPPGLNMHDEEWIGAWWLGFIVCGALYLLTAMPFFFFPKTYISKENEQEMHSLRKKHPDKKHPDLHLVNFEQNNNLCGSACKQSLKEYMLTVFDLLRNPVFVSMALAWTFGSYLIAGYNTYLPKYLEKQFGETASMADFYTAIISIGAIASSTAIGGWLLTRIDVKPRKAILLLCGSWLIVLVTYLAGMIVHCEQPTIEGLRYVDYIDRWSLSDELSCSSDCGCRTVLRYDPVNVNGLNFYSPCHAGCREFDYFHKMWTSCYCAPHSSSNIYRGLDHNTTCDSSNIFIYVTIMFIGLFLGNLFFITTMMIVLRSVYDDQKVAALSVASCTTNLLGFVPAPMLFGLIIDSTCILWHSRCQNDQGNCVLYDNSSFRFWFHSTNAGLQALAVACVIICYFMARRRKFPEEEDDDPHEYEVTSAIHN